MIKEITLEEAIRRHLNGENITLIVVSDDTEEEPQKEKEEPQKEKEEPEKEKEEHQKPQRVTLREQIDWGRVWALRKAKWTWDKIAEDVHVAYGTLYNAKDCDMSVKAKAKVYGEESDDE